MTGEEAKYSSAKQEAMTVRPPAMIMTTVLAIQEDTTLLQNAIAEQFGMFVE